jgi:hypothetical protein
VEIVRDLLPRPVCDSIPPPAPFHAKISAVEYVETSIVRGIAEGKKPDPTIQYTLPNRPRDDAVPLQTESHGVKRVLSVQLCIGNDETICSGNGLA